MQRLGKYKWYAYSFQTATEKEGTSINPQYMFLEDNDKQSDFKMYFKRIRAINILCNT